MITVIGAGLAGSLLALELVDRELAVTLIDAGASARATDLSYGLLPWTAASRWWQLQRRDGDLGLAQRWLQLGKAGLPLPAWQVNPRSWARGVAAALGRAGVPQLQQ
ncbi:MAG: hypothetical protein FJ050_05745, partial [Cyanobacteria bacterium M_surface_7_m2_040]|nr:hypothetical protein [Cyanobacteria bacterium M_surface_7_m2_040]